AAAAWAYLLAGHGGFWRTGVRLPASAPDPASWPGVIAVVPARDEAAMLPETLPSLLAQEGQGRFAVVVVEHPGSAGTPAGAAGAGGGADAAGQGGLEVVSGAPPPTGWAGKVWAMRQGLQAAADRGADYVLFTDADIRYAPGAVAALARSAEADDRVLVSQMA